jgi:hypothetical protein
MRCEQGFFFCGARLGGVSRNSATQAMAMTEMEADRLSRSALSGRQQQVFQKERRKFGSAAQGRLAVYGEGLLPDCGFAGRAELCYFPLGLNPFSNSRPISRSAGERPQRVNWVVDSFTEPAEGVLCLPAEPLSIAPSSLKIN